jgi:PAS domain S-box-containing protein
MQYGIEKGQRFYEEGPLPFNRLAEHLIATREPVIINDNAVQHMAELGLILVPGTEVSKSLLYVPLIAGSQVTGSISIQNVDREHAFSEPDVRLLTTLANSMSVALENARLFGETNRLLAETRQRTAELATVNRISRGLASQLDLTALVQLVGEQLRDTFNADIAYVALLDRESQLIHFPYMFGDRLPSLPLGEGLTSRIILTGQPLLLNSDIDTRRSELEVRPVGLPSLSYLGVPIPAGDQTIGVLSVQSTREEGRFDDNDLRLLSTAAAHVGTAIQNARLYQETQQRAGQMATIAEVGREVSASLELSTVLERIARQVHSLCRGRDTVLYLLQPDNRVFRSIVALGRYAEQYRSEETWFGEGITGSIAESGVAEVIDNIGQDPRVVHVAGTPEAGDPPETMMCAPLTSRGQTIGLLSVYRDVDQGLFSQTDLDFLVALVRQAAAAVENARLFEAARESERRLADIIEFLPDATLVIDRAGRVIAWNQAMEEMTGVPADEMLGQGDHAYAVPFYGQRRPILIDLVLLPDQELETRYASLQRSGGTLIGEALVPQLRGRPAVLLATASALHDSKGEIVGAIETIRDISDRKRAEEELRQAKATAEAATQAKSAFLATMSHEIRTPMNAVIGMTSLLLDTPLSPEQRDFAETIRSSGDSLLTIINDILDFSKIEAGRLDLESAPFDLRECVEGALDLLAPKAREKNLNLAYLMEPGVPPAITGDATRLRQILVNLVGNAVKFTESGEVVVSVSCEEDAELPAVGRRGDAETLTASPPLPLSASLHFAVRDTGLGIPPDRMDRLFQSFSQVDGSTTRKYGGTGLGLAISRRLAELMGGRMWAESSGISGQGSTFHFTMQAQPASLPTHADLQAEAPDLAGRRVLIVDDNATNRRILTLQTEAWGMLPRATGSPAEALDWMRGGEHLDVGILDRQMPEMDGLMLASAIKALRPLLPLIMVSSLGAREAGAEAAGIGTFLLKPVKPSQLYNALAGIFVQGHEAARRTAAAAAAPQFDAEMGKRLPLRILLAEDNVVNQKLALRLLERLGYRADVAANGLEAVRAVERQPYDVVFMDVQMPEMDGLEATREICSRWQPGSRRPRIVAMTANALAEDRQVCLEAGMDDYLAKPIRVDELVAALSRCVGAER